MQSLLNKKIVLGISGGIAAYKTPELARQLIQEGATVQVVMTQAATQFVTPVTMQALTGNPVFTSQWDSSVSNNMAHIELSRSADAIVIAPASADLMAKLSLGLADDLLSTLCLARDCPLLLAPAMNKQMWEHAATQRSVERLNKDRVTLLGPASGFQACGEVGMGRMLEPFEITEQVIAFFQKKPLIGKKVLITAGPTFEPIDPVRGITNLSSGKMGYALARAAHAAGAEVTLVSGPTALPIPYGIKIVSVITARDMYDAVMAHIAHQDIFIAVAAVADWRVSEVSQQKIKKQNATSPELQFEQNPDILAAVAALPKPPYCVGFAAESENLLEHGAAKREKKRIPLLVGNIGHQTFGKDDNELVLFDANGHKNIARASKAILAGKLIEEIAHRL